MNKDYSMVAFIIGVVLSGGLTYCVATCSHEDEEQYRQRLEEVEQKSIDAELRLYDLENKIDELEEEVNSVRDEITDLQ